MTKYALATLACAGIFVAYLLIAVALRLRLDSGYFRYFHFLIFIGALGWTWRTITKKGPPSPINAPQRMGRNTQYQSPTRDAAPATVPPALPTNAVSTQKAREIYALAYQESQEDATNRDIGIWAMALVKAQGDVTKCQAIYIEQRVNDLMKRDLAERAVEAAKQRVRTAYTNRNGAELRHELENLNSLIAQQEGEVTIEEDLTAIAESLVDIEADNRQHAHEAELARKTATADEYYSRTRRALERNDLYDAESTLHRWRSLDVPNDTRLPTMMALAEQARTQERAVTARRTRIAISCAAGLIAIIVGTAVLVVHSAERRRNEDRVNRFNMARNAANTARDASNWDQVLEQTSTMLSIDPTDNEAVALRKVAEDNIVPSLIIVAINSAGTMAALVTYSAQSWITPARIPLTPNQPYTLTVSAPPNSQRRIKPVQVSGIADWRGVRTERVSLEEEPSLSIVAIADGKEIKGTVSCGKENWTTPITLDVIPGQSYQYTITYESSETGTQNRKWFKPATVAIVADWKGPRTRRVELEEDKGPSENQTRRIPGIDMTFQLVSAGRFQMGALGEDKNETPVHEVNIARDFWIGKTEVTQGQWMSLMGENPSCFKGDDDKPVEMVKWEDCEAFCRELTKRETLAGRVLAGYEYRLPTESEWEYAARGGARSKGFKYSGGDTLNNVAWNYASAGHGTHTVGGKKPNELGICDMSGNVEEWCLDVWHGSYNDAPTDGSNWKDGNATYHVVRGGSWCWATTEDISGCHLTKRKKYTTTLSASTLGFRVVLGPILPK